jgi:PhoH-like ATPase
MTMTKDQFLIETVEDLLIDDIYKSKDDLSDFLQVDLSVGEYLTLQSETNPSKKAILFQGGNKIHLMKQMGNKKGLNPKDVDQNLFMQLLHEEWSKLIVCLASAGAGKTLLSIDYALNEVLKHKNMKLIMTKPLCQVGSSKFMSTLPGDVKEKSAPFNESFMTAMQQVCPSKEYIQSLFDKEVIEYKPLDFMRGQTFHNTILILDEAQNLNYVELKTVISRLGENSKIIILADRNQIDAKHTWQQSGLYQLMNTNVFKKSSICAKIELHKVYRSEIAQFIVDADKEINDLLNTPISMYNL